MVYTVIMRLISWKRSCGSETLVNPSPMCDSVPGWPVTYLLSPFTAPVFQRLLVINHNLDGWVTYTNLQNFDQVQLKMA